MAHSPLSFTSKMSSFILMMLWLSSAWVSVPDLAHSLHTLMRESCEQLANNSSPPEWVRVKNPKTFTTKLLCVFCKISYCRIYPHFASFYLIRSCPSMKCVVLWNIVVLFWCEQKQWQSKKTIERSDTLTLMVNILERVENLITSLYCSFHKVE